MKILYLFSRDQDATSTALIAAQRREHQITIRDLREEEDFGSIVDIIAETDQVISW